MNIREFITFVLSLILTAFIFSILVSFIPKIEQIEEMEIKDKSIFIDLCKNNGGLLLSENVFGREKLNSLCYYNKNEYSFYFGGQEKLKKQILIDNFNKNGK